MRQIIISMAVAASVLAGGSVAVLAADIGETVKNPKGPIWQDIESNMP